MPFPLTKAWYWSARISSSPATSGPVSSRDAARRRRRTTASILAMTSSGWLGLLIQSSAPSRSPRTRWATVERLEVTTTPRPGTAPHTRSRNSQAWGPSTSMSTSRALSFIATSSSTGTLLESTRCSHPAPSRRLMKTVRNAVSVSMTASRVVPD